MRVWPLLVSCGSLVAACSDDVAIGGARDDLGASGAAGVDGSGGASTEAGAAGTAASAGTSGDSGAFDSSAAGASGSAGTAGTGGSSGGAGTAGSGGGDAGGDACSTADDDGDGFSVCDGDCDDSSAFTFPGAPEVCGDAATNDCASSALADDGCGGEGTFAAPPPFGSPTGNGTMASPFDDIAAAIVKSDEIERGGGPADLDVYVAAGDGTPGSFDIGDSLILFEGVSLLGGYDPIDWRRDITNNVVNVDSGLFGILVDSSITRGTEVSGFTFNEGTTLTTNVTTTVIDITDGSPTIRDNIIFMHAGGGEDRAIYGLGTSARPRPLILNNLVIGGPSSTGQANAIHFEIAEPEIRNNVVRMPRSSDNPPSGIWCSNCEQGTEIVGNTVDGEGISNPLAFGLSVSSGGGLVDSNQVHPGTCVVDGCVGINLETIGANGLDLVVSNNVAYGGDGVQSFALLFNMAELASPPSTRIVNNYLHGGDSPTGLSSGLAFEAAGAVQIAAGDVANNIVHSGTGLFRWAIRERSPVARPLSVQNNVLTVPTDVGATSVLYEDRTGAQLSIGELNMITGNSNNAEGTCGLVSATWMGDHHLTAGATACIDRAAPSFAPPNDFDGVARGPSPDIGPDER